MTDLDEIGKAIGGGGPPDPAVIAEIRARHDIQQLTPMNVGRRHRSAADGPWT